MESKRYYEIKRFRYFFLKSLNLRFFMTNIISLGYFIHSMPDIWILWRSLRSDLHNDSSIYRLRALHYHREIGRRPETR